MPEQPDVAAIQQIHHIARQLAERQGLDEEQVEEICGHLEDKLLAYLSGEVRITPDDAVLLARAHFGDAVGIARQLAYEVHPIRPELHRRRTLMRTAIFTAAATLIGLPGTLLLFGDPPASLHGLLIGGLILLGCLAVLESGVLLAALTDPQSRWQRVVAAGFVFPALAVLFVALAAGLNALSTYWHLPMRGGYAVIAAIELACLIGHVFLFLLLALPLRGKSEKFSVAL